jgi:MSHA pilin protein MshD
MSFQKFREANFHKFHFNRGITLIEMVAVIVVLSLAIPALLTMWADVAWRSVRSEAIGDAAFYAQQLMEEIKSKRFDENDSSPWTSNLGPEPGETITGTGDSSFDDVDDYNGYSDNPAIDYSRSCTVDYVELSDSTWQAATSPPTDFKRIRVAVWRTDNLVSDVSLVTIVSAY